MEVFNDVWVSMLLFGIWFLIFACPLSYLSTSRNPVVASNLMCHAYSS